LHDPPFVSMRHAFDDLRKAVAINAALAEVSGKTILLILPGTICVPLGVLTLNRGFHITRARGGLAECCV